MDIHLKNLNLCDFCCEAIVGPFKIYPCGTFTCQIDPTFTSVGDWQACLSCVELIDTEQWAALEDRCIYAILSRGMHRDAYAREWAEYVVRSRHRQFRKHRIPDKRVA
jgi:hypothetical protein